MDADPSKRLSSVVSSGVEHVIDRIPVLRASGGFRAKLLHLRHLKDRSNSSRYRLEAGVPCVDVKINSIEQLFDNRDPAPFRERDLDPGLAQYLRDAAEDLAEVGAYRVVFWLENPCPPGEIEQAFHAHFENVLERIQRERRRRRRTGQAALSLAVVLVIVLLSLGQLVGKLVPGTLGVGLREGLVISSWVVMWRPIEVLIYDWIPVRHERKVLSKLLAATIDVRIGKPLDA